ncbi:hypothetical protein Z046_19145 [Pseudomonas aeruginosa VRFPA09]|nr:hypothetical protein Z046_19145 [Pseudomonas aeruginosa VRFPA09]
MAVVGITLEDADLPSVTAEATPEGDILRRVTFSPAQRPTLRMSPAQGRWDWSAADYVSLRIQNAMSWDMTLEVALWLQALGVLACLLPGIGGLALGVVLTGLPFLAGMQLVMQYARELAPHTPQRNAGQLTTGFALGQLLGPLLAALSTHFAGGLQPALALAGLGLVFAGLLLRRPHSLSVAAGVAATARR